MLNNRNAFTLIELLIVVAIIAILAAIAVPNFLEAQTRAKVSRSLSDMRSLVTAMETYVVDHNKAAPPLPPDGNPDTVSWWGFCPTRLTTPIAYITSLPTMAFLDEKVTGFWTINLGGETGNQPYTYMYDVYGPLGDRETTGWEVMNIGPAANNPSPYNVSDAKSWFDDLEKSAWFFYVSGPDGMDMTVWGNPMYYDATNGTSSFGDIYKFGSGDSGSTSVSDDRLP